MHVTELKKGQRVRTFNGVIGVLEDDHADRAYRTLKWGDHTWVQGMLHIEKAKASLDVESEWVEVQHGAR